MSLIEATKYATTEAKLHNYNMVVVHAPLEHVEDESGPYGYCPINAIHILYRHALEGIGQTNYSARGIVVNINRNENYRK